MGVFDIFRRKKKEEANFGGGFETNPNPEPIDYGGNFKPAFADTGFQSNFNQPPTFQTQSFQQPLAQNNFSSSDVQLIIAKLDLVNQRLEVLDRRLQVIEQIAKESK